MRWNSAEKVVSSVFGLLSVMNPIPQQLRSREPHHLPLEGMDQVGD